GEDYRDRIKGRSAGLVIGDRAFEQRLVSPYIYDLGAAWLAHTGLPFVFAAWIANKPLPAAFIQRFNEANAMGFEHLDEVVAENPYAHFPLYDYYTKYIDYRLDDQKRAALELFVEKVRQYS
ncbi:MAG: hypothetical protein EOO15_24300, partial [Chitinophagaceae bacterium]